MDHIVRPRNRHDLNAPAFRCLTNTGCQGSSNLIWQRWQTGTDQIELHAVQVMRSHRIEHLLQAWTGKRFRENPQSHHTPPVTSVNVTHAPVWTEREIATSARSAATPSSTLAPCRGVPYRIVSAKPSSCSR